MAKVYIDAGHGGSDPGAVDGTKNDSINSQEKVYNLDVAKKLEAALKRCGQSTRMSRTGDTLPSLSARASGANNWGADIFVSVHMNAHYDGSPAKGIEVLHWPTSTKGKALAQKVYDRVKAVSPHGDRGLKPRDNLYVLRATKMPAIIVEYGFITNTEEEKLLASSSYRTRLAEATARGVCDYMGVTYKAPSTPAPAPDPTVALKAEVANLKTQLGKAQSELNASKDALSRANSKIAAAKKALA